MIYFFNILLICFWLRLIPQRSRATFRNPVVYRAARIAESAAAFLQGALPFVPRYAMALAALVFIVVFRGAFAAWTGGLWLESAGFWNVKCDTGTPGSAALFSLISFGILLHRALVLQFALSFFSRRRPAIGRNPFYGALRAIAAPVSDLPRIAQLAIALLLGSLLAQALFRAGQVINPLEVMPTLSEVAPQLGAVTDLAVSPAPSTQIRLAFGVAMVLDVFSTATSLVVVAVLAMLFGGLFNLRFLFQLGGAACDTILSTVFPRPVRIGALNIAPLLFLLLMGVCQMASTFVVLVILGGSK